MYTLPNNPRASISYNYHPGQKKKNSILNSHSYPKRALCALPCYNLSLANGGNHQSTKHYNNHFPPPLYNDHLRTHPQVVRFSCLFDNMT